ncbi:hypothetical protein BC629DRAFT_1105845 [Irpex lacteus]|nr:hypothetical protein BC629DRAFT_1105845 [Irpex lacteus]
MMLLQSALDYFIRLLQGIHRFLQVGTDNHGDYARINYTEVACAIYNELQKVPYKDAAFYTVFLQLVGELYAVNSVLAALNARNSLRGGNDTSTVSVSLSNIASTRRDASTVRAPQPVVIGRSYNGPFDHSFGESPVKSDRGENDYKSDNSDVTRSIAITRTVDAV